MSQWGPYVSVAKRRAKAKRAMAKLRKQGQTVLPIEIEGRKIARTFWGNAWCEHLESFSDYANRLPRGRTYVRNGSVCHLSILPGTIEAIISGSRLYHVTIEIDRLPAVKWKSIVSSCVGQIGSLIELLQGTFSDDVMSVVSHPNKGLFPKPSEIKLDCNCPDWATMCKHVAAVLYGVGARLDHHPELLFTLREVDQSDLIVNQVTSVDKVVSQRSSRRRRMKGNISDVFGVEMVGSNQKEPLSLSRSSEQTASKKPEQDGKRCIPYATKAKSVNPPSAEELKNLRKNMGLNQADFGQLLSVTGATIGRWERKKGTLKFRTAQIEKWAELKNMYG